jgi:thiol:disulfide interchange protein DsbD
MVRLLTLLVALALAAPAFAAPVASPHATTELVASTTSAAPGASLQVAVVQTFAKGWHSYWRNPGDAGEATTIAWTLPAGWSAGPIQWPTPGRLPVGPIMNYGYEGGVVLPVTLKVPADAAVGQTVTLTAVVQFLVCADVCVPDQATVTLPVMVTAAPGAPDPVWGPKIAQTLASLPKPGALTVSYRRQKGMIMLAAVGAPLTGAADHDVYFYPYSDKIIDHAKPQAVERGKAGLTVTLAPVGALAKGGDPPPVEGVLVADGKAFEISAIDGPAPMGASGLGAPKAVKTPNPWSGLLGAMAFAFLGGLILNLMPCVFPILSMKAAALAGHGGEASGARLQALAFLGGVLVTFVALALALIGARAAGEAVGWGFQLQSPTIVAVLALVMLAAALNLSGVFEIGTSAQGLGSGLASRGGLVGSAFTGILAVVVAAPCTAPFMGPALGYALTQPPVVAVAVFLALGLGFAAPFTLLAFSPALLRRMPRPGVWMDTFKHVLAFPMYAAAAWLVWVLAQQTDSEGLARVLAAGVLLALCVWLFGFAQRRRAAGGRGFVTGGLAAVALVLGVAAVGAQPFAPRAAAGAIAATSAGAVTAEPWSPGKVAEFQAAGRPVFVNFTAAWCVTCQVNERGAFSSAEVARAFAKTKAAYLVADWTNRDATIASALSQQGRIGVPLYLVYDAAGGAPHVLPQLLTPGVVVAALDHAAPVR